MRHACLLLASVAVLLAAPASADHDAHTDEHAGALGTVDFPTSCRAETTVAFTRATALLHSFGYQESRKSFEDVARDDPQCGMSYWGVAMTYYHPLWAAPNAAEFAAGRSAAEKAAAIGAKSDRERAYIAAIGSFYRESDPRARAQAFRQSMEGVVSRFPSDDEAAIFYALTLLATAPPSDTTFANQKEAGKILNRLLLSHSNHPGIAHYLIHSFDNPTLAKDALPAARAYAKIAPSSPHALHMPSHIFTRLGLWQESIASNIASADAGQRLVAQNHPGAMSFDTLHALDYLEYAYLQVGDEAKARAVLEEVARATTFDEPNFAAAYALAAVPARWALERHDWKAAAALELPAIDLPWSQYAYVPAVTHFARAIGAARSGQLTRAREAVGNLQQVQMGLAKSPPPGPYDWAAHVESLRLAAAGVVARIEGRDAEALRLLRSAAELDEKTGKHPVTPGSVLPPRELLGDVLLEQGRSIEALAEYEAALRDAPNQFNSLAGAARAANNAGNRQRAAEFYKRLLEMVVTEAQRPELKEARRVLSGGSRQE